MRKYFVFAAAALVMIAACNKNGSGNSGELIVKPAQPEWLTDESLPVPIQFGSPVEDTKGTVIDAAAFSAAGFRYAVIGLEKTTGDVMDGFGNGVLAKNVAGSGDLSAASLMTEFVNGPLYYPYMYSQGQYNFYGYRTSDAIDQGTLPTLYGTSVNNIAIGQTDILYAAAVADPTKESAAATAYYTEHAAPTSGSATAYGFSAKYIRGARIASTVNDNLVSATYITYLPKLTFEHLTSQFIFYVKTVDAEAASSLSSAGVAIQGITIGGVQTTANLNLTTGALTGTGNNGTVIVTAPDSFTFSDTAKAWGQPIFLLPGGSSVSFSMDLALPNSITATISQTLNAPDENGFEAGKAYKFTVILQGIEKVQIVTALTPWETAIEAGNVEFD